jgi:hypothetical protein
MELFLHSLICLRDFVLNALSTKTISQFLHEQYTFYHRSVYMQCCFHSGQVILISSFSLHMAIKFNSL